MPSPVRLPRVLSRAHSVTLLRLMFIGALQGGAMVATVLLTQRIFDRYMVAAADLDGLTASTVELMAIAVAAAALRWWEVVEAERLGQRYVHDLRTRLFDHLHHLDARSLQSMGRGPLMLRFIGDMSALRQWVSRGIARMTVAIVMLFGALLALVAISPMLAGVVALAGAIGAFASAWLGRPLEAAVRAARQRRTVLVNNIAEKANAMVVVQAHGQYRREARRLARQSSELLRELVLRASRVGALRAVADAVVRLTTAGVLVVGALEVSRQAISPGTVVAAIAIVGLLVPAMRNLGRVHEYWKSAAVSREKILAFLRSGPVIVDRFGAVPVPDGEGEVRFVDVIAPPLRKPFSAVAAAGSHVAITGPNGSGKSTLLWLAARLLEPDAGHIELDHHDLKTIKLTSLRRTLGMVSADLPLLRGSLRRNLSYRSPSASSEELERVRSACELDEILERLPNGLSSRLVDGARNLSTGERMRLAFARALLDRPRLLLLDEPEAGLDAATRALVVRLVGQFAGTVLMVTHDPAVAASADAEWHIEGGEVRIVERGRKHAATVVNLRPGT